MENIFAKSEVVVITKSGVELMLFVVFVPYLDKYIVDCEVNVKRKGSWLKRKLELAHLLAAEQTGGRVAKALIERYNSYVSTNI